MPKVICFDFDDVLTNKNAAYRLSKLFGHKFDMIKYGIEILEDNKHPEKFFKDVKSMIKLTKGIPYEYIERIVLLLKLNKNAKHLLKSLKKKGYKIVIISINDEGLIKKFLKKNNVDEYIDHIYACKLCTKNGILTGLITGDAVKTEKVGIVRKLENLYKVKRSDIIYVGDGLTDLPIIKKVGKGILFNPNPLANAEVLIDKDLMKMKNEGRLFLIDHNDLSKILDFVS